MWGIFIAKFNPSFLESLFGTGPLQLNKYLAEHNVRLDLPDNRLQELFLPHSSILDILIPIIREKKKLTIAQLGQSIDGRIALNNGKSHYINNKKIEFKSVSYISGNSKKNLGIECFNIESGEIIKIFKKIIKPKILLLLKLLM